MANKFQALLALLSKNNQAQGQQTPVNNQYQGLAQLLPPLDTNATARNAGVQTLQQGMFQQQHPLLSGIGQGIKKGAKKAKHYLLDPVYNTPTGDATIDATDPNKFTDSRLGRYGSLALLAGAGFATGAPALGALAGAKMMGSMRQNDLADYQARLGKKATADIYRQAGIQYNPLLDEKDQSKLTDLQIKNKERLAGLRLLANPNATAQYVSNGQQKIVDPATGKVTYTAGLEENSPYAIFADPRLLVAKGQQRQRQQQLDQEADYRNKQILLGEKRVNLSKAKMAQQERHFQQSYGLSYARFQEAKAQARKTKPQATTELERALANGQIDEQTFVNLITKTPRDKYTGEFIQPKKPKEGTVSTTEAGVDTKVQPSPTAKQTIAQKELLPAPKRTPQGGYKTSLGDLQPLNITIGR